MTTAAEFQERLDGIVCRMREGFLDLWWGRECERRRFALLFIGQAANEGRS